MSNILITGGAGYIGSAIVKKCCDLKHRVVVVDDLSKGQKKFVDKRCQFYKIDINNQKKLDSVFSNHKVDAVIHLAAKKAIGESEEVPQLYMETNIGGTINLLNAMIKFNCKKIIFSSTASVYQPNESGIYSETDPLQASNVYGYTKIIGEQVIQEYARTIGLDFVIFRYFNVVGDVGLKFQENNPQNVFPIICEAFLKKGKIGKAQDTFYIFGNNYPTKDGSGVRDYFHLSDLVDSHIMGIDYPKNEIFNLGTKQGTSVFELVNEFEMVSGHTLKTKVMKRRKGDVAKCLANPSKANRLLKWKSQHTLHQMVNDCYLSYIK